MKTTIHLLPGTMCDERLWTRMRTHFDENYKLVHVPIPSHDCFATMAEELASTLPEENINLFGFSMGGYLAATFALKYPERINKAFLCASSPRAYPPDERRIRENGLNYLHTNGFRELSREKIRTLLDQANYEDEELITLLQTMYHDFGLGTLTNQLEASLKRENLLMELVSVDVPLTFCYSHDDVMIKRSWLNILSKQKRGASFIEYEGASHMLPLEKPKELADEIKEWAGY